MMQIYQQKILKACWFVFLALVYVILCMAIDMRELVNHSISLRPDGKIYIPADIKRIKLDIGLSYSAPMSQEWLTREDDLLVFGFEPNPEAVASILNGATKRHSEHGNPLEVRFIGKRFFLIPCALGRSLTGTIPLFVTQVDCGCSSIYRPNSFAIERVVEVPIFSLADFFDLFPFDTHPVIEYIKIDAQGSDLDIVKSAGHYIAERVVYITLEPENDQYAGTKNSLQEIETYFRSIGFVRHISVDVIDPTYVNLRYLSYAKKQHIKIWQR